MLRGEAESLGVAPRTREVSKQVHQTGTLYSLVLDVRVELGRFESVPSLAQNPRSAREPNLPDCCARVSRAAMLRPRR